MSESESKHKAEFEKMFLDKLTLLNKTFLKVIQGCVKDMPDADLSPTVRDYLKHVESLDKMYGEKVSENKVTKRVIKSVKRSRKRESSPGKPIVDSSANESIISITRRDSVKSVATPTITSSPIAAFKSSETAPLVKFNFEKSISENVASDNSRRGTKRLKRGDMDGSDVEVIVDPYKTTNSTTASKVPVSIKPDIAKKPIFFNASVSSTKDELNNASSSVSDAKIRDISTSSSSFNTSPLFPANSTKEKKNAVINLKTEDKVKLPPLFSFGTASKPNAFFTQTSAPLEASKGASESNSLFSFNKASGKSNDSTGSITATKDLSSTKSSVTVEATPSMKPIFAFKGQSVAKDFSVAKPLSSTAFSGFKFGPTSGAAETSKTEEKGLKFGSSSSSDAAKISFGSSAVTSESDKSISSAASVTDPKEEEKEEEHVPPKVEAVVQDEPDAVLSTKCSVFALKGKEYEKVGIGQLHIKKINDEEKKIFLIRAATTIGTVWVNTYIDDKLKFTKIDDVKLRVSCVSNNIPSTYLIRLPNIKVRENVEKELDSNS